MDDEIYGEGYSLVIFNNLLKSTKLPFAAAAQQSNERRPERFVEDGVDYRVDSGRHVAQPQAYVDDSVRYFHVGPRRKDDVQYEERRPAEYEGEKH